MYGLVHEQIVCLKECPRHGGGIGSAISAVLAQLTKVRGICVNCTWFFPRGATACTSTHMLAQSTERVDAVPALLEICLH